MKNLENWGRKSLCAIACIFPFTIAIAYFGIPYFDGWSEIVWPRSSNLYSWVFLFWDDSWMWVSVGAQCVCFLVALARKWSSINRGITFTLLLVLVLIWQLPYSSRTSYTQRRIEAFPIGGWTRMIWAGGPRKLQSAAETLISVALDSNPPKVDWPSTIKKLGASYIEIDTSTKTVNVHLPRKNAFSDQFGFLIQITNNATISLPGEYRIWQLAESIYFYETW